jgi:hypothetical protein
VTTKQMRTPKGEFRSFEAIETCIRASNSDLHDIVHGRHTNKDLKHAVRHAACKYGRLNMSVEAVNGLGLEVIPVAVPGAHVSRSGWKLSHRSRDRHAPQRMSQGRPKLNVWTRSQER